MLAPLLLLFVYVCAALIANKAKEISRLNSVYVNLLRNAGVAYYEGKGSLLDKNTVQVGAGVVPMAMCPYGAGGLGKPEGKGSLLDKNRVR